MSLNKCEYVKARQSLLDKVFGHDHLYAGFNYTYWICTTCYSALSRNQMPVQSIANNLEWSLITIAMPPCSINENGGHGDGNCLFGSVLYQLETNGVWKCNC